MIKKAAKLGWAGAGAALGWEQGRAGVKPYRRRAEQECSRSKNRLGEGEEQERSRAGAE